MELYFQKNSRRAEALRSRITPSERLLAGLAVETGIELERQRQLPLSADQVDEMSAVEDRWTESIDPHDERLYLLNRDETRWAMTGLSYLGRSFGARALNAIILRSDTLPLIGDALASTADPDIGTPSHSLRRAARAMHRGALRSLTDTCMRPTHNAPFFREDT